LRQVVKRQVPLRLEVHREDDLRSAALADELRLRVVLDGVSNPGTAAEGIVSRKLPLVLGPFVEMDDIPAYRRNRPADWPKMLLTPESRWALGTFSSQPRGSRLLRVHAAAAVALGIEPDRVLRAMTRDAADLLGIGDRLGTIAPGKQADLAVFAGDPLDPRCRCGSCSAAARSFSAMRFGRNPSRRRPARRGPSLNCPLACRRSTRSDARA
jgi:imidazolonepropionase-like amidohydrolase